MCERFSFTRMRNFWLIFRCKVCPLNIVHCTQLKALLFIGLCLLVSPSVMDTNVTMNDIHLKYWTWHSFISLVFTSNRVSLYKYNWYITIDLRRLSFLKRQTSGNALWKSAYCQVSSKHSYGTHLDKLISGWQEKKLGRFPFFLHFCYHTQMFRDSVSPICRIFFFYIRSCSSAKWGWESRKGFVRHIAC